MYNVKRKIHRSYQKDSHGIFAPRINYVDSVNSILFEVAADIYADKCEFYRSIDNGITWNKSQESWNYNKHKVNGYGIVSEPPISIFVDPVENVAFRMNVERAVTSDDKACSYCLPECKYARQLISYSYDSGVSWTDPEPIIVEGDEYNSLHWMEGVELLSNSAIIDGTNILKLSDGDILIGGKRHHLWPSGDVYNSCNHFHFDAFTLRGTWNESKTRLIWHTPSFVPHDYNYCQKGLCEVAMAEISQGNIAMVGRNQWPGNEDLPMMRMLSVSNDGGKSWGNVKPLCYENGDIVPSVASFSILVKSFINNKIYFIGNILPELLYWRKLYSKKQADLIGLAANPPQGLSDPRHTLHIAEFDCENMCIKRNTVTVIDSRWEGEPIGVRLSNFNVYQDRNTGSIVLHMTRNPGNVGWQSSDGISCDIFCYEIEVN